MKNIEEKQIEECSCQNIGLINDDWLCLECGEKVENPNFEITQIERIKK